MNKFKSEDSFASIEGNGNKFLVSTMAIHPMYGTTLCLPVFMCDGIQNLVDRIIILLAKPNELLDPKKVSEELEKCVKSHGFKSHRKFSEEAKMVNIVNSNGTCQISFTRNHGGLRGYEPIPIRKIPLIEIPYSSKADIWRTALEDSFSKCEIVE